MNLNNFPDQINVVVIGASGGIGQGFVRHFLEMEQVAKVYAFARGAIGLEHPKLIQNNLDLTNEDSIKAASETIKDKCHIVLTATGVLHGDKFAPEKALRNLDGETAKHVLDVNYVGPSLVGKYFLPLMSRDEKSVFAMLSARVGSISDNQLGGWYSYRASKAALNMFIKTASIEVARKYKQASVIGLHPGTVDTDLSNPFSSNVAEHKLFTSEYSTENMLRVVNDVTPEQSGNLFAYDGEVIQP